jgi:hypothetical protein
VEQKRRINRVRDLPDWFDLAKYEGFAALDVHGWSRQISIRSLMSCCLKGIYDLGESFVQNWLATIIENPIIDPHHGSEHPHIWHSSKAEKPYDSYSVWSLSAMDAFCVGNELKGTDQEGNALSPKPRPRTKLTTLRLQLQRQSSRCWLNTPMIYV